MGPYTKESKKKRPIKINQFAHYHWSTKNKVTDIYRNTNDEILKVMIHTRIWNVPEILEEIRVICVWGNFVYTRKKTHEWFIKYCIIIGSQKRNHHTIWAELCPFHASKCRQSSGSPFAYIYYKIPHWAQRIVEKNGEFQQKLHAIRISLNSSKFPFIKSNFISSIIVK